jgi:hypothetical protein
MLSKYSLLNAEEATPLGDKRSPRDEVNKKSGVENSLVKAETEIVRLAKEARDSRLQVERESNFEKQRFPHCSDLGIR